MLQAFRIVTFICTIIFGYGALMDAEEAYAKSFLSAGILFLAATAIQVSI